MESRIVVLGNKDHGKSTLIGSLLMETGAVTAQRVDDARKTSESLGRKFEPGYILDSFEEERKNEMTIDTTRAYLTYKGSRIEFIDVPGHEELIKNMMSGASYADSALLIVSAREIEGFTEQSRRHLFIASMLGIRKLVVAINKMDAVGYSDRIFENTKKEIEEYIMKVGISFREIFFVPVSAYNAENLCRPSGNMRWYNGTVLVELLSWKSVDNGDAQKEGVATLRGFLDREKGIVMGRVVAGKIMEGEELSLMPQGSVMRITELFVGEQKKESALKGENIAFVPEERISSDVRGSVISSQGAGIESSVALKARIFIVSDISGDVSIKMNGIASECAAIKVIETTDIMTGKRTGKARIIPMQNTAYAEIETVRPLVYAQFRRIPELGRFMIYSNGSFSGIGLVE
jgi:translation elongation factor EF-1alpha